MFSSNLLPPLQFLPIPAYENENRNCRRPRNVRPRTNFIENFDDIDFKMRFRFSKATVEVILNLIGANLKATSLRNDPISPINQVLITLRFYATGSFQLCTGDNFLVSQSSVSRIFAKISHYIALKSNIYITMPQTRFAIGKINSDFYKIARFPRVLGTIDGTHIKIQSPGGDTAELYRNRKGWFSINVQMVANANLKVMDIVTCYPGSAHDSTIFNESRLRVKLEDDAFGDCYLLGDSAYPCRKYLLTPLHNPRTPAEVRYNKSHIHTRNTVERAFGVLKRRFPCLSLGLRVALDRVDSIIIATTVLNNIAIDRRDEMPPDENIVHNEFQEIFNIGNENIVNQNFAIRNAIINTFFNR